MAEKTVAEVMGGYDAFEGVVPEEFRCTNEQIHTLQINVGYKCNLACRHCHLQCGPSRTEMMSREVMDACLEAARIGDFSSIDITGGAPEMHPDYERFLHEIAELGIPTMCRTNLCILTQPEYAHFAEVYAELDVHLVASLPYYSARTVDKVRGGGAFEKSIEAMHVLNNLGFGTGEHVLTLVYNPAGAVLPPAQASAEAEYKAKLREGFGVEFDNLIAIANNPSGRFAEALNAKGNLGRYMDRLTGAFNVATCAGMMCRDQISVDWQGAVYDCDFNQALGLPIETGQAVFDFAKTPAGKRRIVFANHCYGCTAGAGSSCGGATA